MKPNKKAFTIVELVIVIAIIAVLAAVLIPTFANVINKANVAKDTQLIRNLNTALASDRASNNNEPHHTLYDALQAAEAFGYDIGKINASATNAEILWDQENDVFCYLEGTKVVYLPELVDTNKRLATDIRPYHLWKIFDEKHPISENTYGFSIYWNGSAQDEIIIDGLGFDAGTATVSKISYEYTQGTARNVIIRTNSVITELIVDAPNDTVKHYDAVGTVHVIAVDGENCYEENGKAAFTQVDSGKYKTSATADVKLLFVSDSSKVTLEIAEGTVDHAHAISAAEAEAINSRNPGVVFDYDGNSAQSALDVYHHDVKGNYELTTAFDSNKSKEAVVEVVDELAGDEVAQDPNAENYVARVGTKGYLTLKDAIDAARSNPKSVVYTLKEDITLTANIGEITDDGIVNGLQNEIRLTKDTTLRFSAFSIQMMPGGKISLDGHALTLASPSGGNGIYFCQALEENQDYTTSGTSAQILVDELTYDVAAQQSESLPHAFYYHATQMAWVHGSTVIISLPSYTINVNEEGYTKVYAGVVNAKNPTTVTVNLDGLDFVNPTIEEWYVFSGDENTLTINTEDHTAQEVSITAKFGSNTSHNNAPGGAFLLCKLSDQNVKYVVIFDISGPSGPQLPF